MAGKRDYNLAFGEGGGGEEEIDGAGIGTVDEDAPMSPRNQHALRYVLLDAQQRSAREKGAARKRVYRATNPIGVPRAPRVKSPARAKIVTDNDDVDFDDSRKNAYDAKRHAILQHIDTQYDYEIAHSRLQALNQQEHDEKMVKLEILIKKRITMTFLYVGMVSVILMILGVIILGSNHYFFDTVKGVKDAIFGVVIRG